MLAGQALDPLLQRNACEGGRDKGADIALHEHAQPMDTGTRDRNGHSRAWRDDEPIRKPLFSDLMFATQGPCSGAICMVRQYGKEGRAMR